MSCCNKDRSKTFKKINELENKINIELEKAELLRSLLNCENVDKIKQLLQKKFNEILVYDGPYWREAFVDSTK